MDADEAAFAEGLAQAISTTMTFLFSSNVVVAGFASVVLYFLWGMINGLQLIALSSLFKIKLPANVNVVNIEILRVAAFDLFKTEWMI